MHPRWEQLRQNMRRARACDKSVRPQDLARLFFSGKAVIINDPCATSPHPIGFGALLKTNSPRWTQIGLLFVAQRFERNEVADAIVRSLVRKTGWSDQVFLVARPGFLQEVAIRQGFSEVRSHTFPCGGVREWAASLGIFGRIPGHLLQEPMPTKHCGSRLFVR